MANSFEKTLIGVWQWHSFRGFAQYRATSIPLFLVPKKASN